MLLFVSIGFWDFVCMQIILLHWMKSHQTMSKQHCIKIKKSFSFFLPFSAGFSQVSSLFYCNHLVSTWKATYKKRIIWNGINGRTLGDRDPFLLTTFWPFSLYVVLVFTRSAWTHMTQGSFLAPLLYPLYTADLSDLHTLKEVLPHPWNHHGSEPLNV